jgi:signal transduction histidine kinase
MKNIKSLNSSHQNFKSAFTRSIIVYLTALGLILTLIVSGFFLEKRISNSQKKFANIINLSGRQRMLSQRIAVFVQKSWAFTTQEQQIANNIKINEILNELKSTMKNLTQDLSDLHLIELNNEKTKKIEKDNLHIVNDFFNSTNEFIKTNYVPQKSQSLRDAINHILNLATGPILKYYDDLTYEREIEANKTIAEYDQFKFILFLSSLLLILLEAIFIFYPLAKSNLENSLLILYQKVEEEKLKKLSLLGEVIAKIIHEINNPLTIISIKIKHLKRDLHFEDESNKAIESIDKNVLRILKIIKSTKAIYRNGENDTLSLVSLKVVIEDAVLAAKILNEKNNIVIKMNIVENVTINALEHQIFQIVINLINNAIESTEHLLAPQILIELFTVKEGAILRVSDNGPGVPLNFDQKIFDPLFTTKSNGTGIGLYESKKIIESYAGDIRLNRKHSSSSFEIVFPISLILEKPYITAIKLDEPSNAGTIEI